MNYLVVTIKSWNIENFEKLKKRYSEHDWFLITDKRELTLERIKSIQPRYIFFPHWSWIIKPKVFDSYECVLFHMTDLPYGRGGSPLQNLIVRGHKETKLSAIRVGAGVDTGDVYMKEPLLLDGSAEDIFHKASDIIFTHMIPKIIKQEPEPTPQVGKVVKFARRKPSDGNLQGVVSVNMAYDYIRMLDAEGYSPTFLEDECVRYIFDRAEKKEDYIEARVRIYPSNQ